MQRYFDYLSKDTIRRKSKPGNPIVFRCEDCESLTLRENLRIWPVRSVPEELRCWFPVGVRIKI